MTDVNDSDWELISAYADGEQSEADARALEARLPHEPALQAALDQVRTVSDALSRMRPEPTHFAEAPKAISQGVPANRNWRPLAACASLAAAAVIAVGFLVFPQMSPDSAMELHNKLLAKSYALPDQNSNHAASLGLKPVAPDLELANLYLVHRQDISDGRTLAHYSGRNNCRLTLLSGPEPVSPDAPEGVRVQGWSAGDRHFTLLASGMDRRRFDAIADFLRQATRSPAQPESVLSMKQATDAAAPCLQA